VNPSNPNARPQTEDTQSLGLTVPLHLQQIADEIIE
jgi:hypothetical protein